ncbi:MAG: RHS repeat-associated core domain-containing protein, partial [Cyanobacteria bacterium J06649_12]
LFQNNQVVLPQLDYTYDALYRLILAQGREHRGLYRPANALRPDEAALLPLPANTNNPQALENYSRRFTYDDANNLTQIAHTAANRRFTRDIDIAPDSNRGSVDTGNLAQSYDANGNLTRLPQLRGMEWNSLNQLAAVDVVQRNNGPNDGDYYGYDASGQRVRKVLERQVNGALVIEETLYFGDYELHRVRRGNQIQEAYTTVHAADGRSRIASLHRWTQRRQNQPARQTRYQLDNHQTSVSLELDGDGRILTYEEYFPYGGIAVVAGRSQQEVTRKRYRYAGRERDATTQLYYYGSRYYAPWMGRWLSPDPAGAIDGANVYGYVRGNPVSRIDADGQVAVELNNQGQVARQRQFFENLIQGTANPDPPTRTNARRVLDLEKQILIPSGIVAQRIKAFEALEQAANNPVSASPPTASPAANNSPRRARSNSAPLPGAAPSSGASGNANGSSNNRRSRSASAPNPPPAPPAPPPPTTRPRSNAVSDNPTTRPRSNAISQGPTVLNVATDRKTAVLLAAAIIVAVNLIKLERQRRDVVQEVKGFDRSQLNPVTPRIADNPDLGRVLDDPSPVDSDLNESASESASEASASESSSGADDSSQDDPVDSVESESANDAPQVDQAPAVDNRSRQNNL